VSTHHGDQYLIGDLSSGAHVVGTTYDEWREMEEEDRLGCARGILWAIVFEIMMAAVGLLSWKLHLWPF
jgi:hypothetical protein